MTAKPQSKRAQIYELHLQGKNGEEIARLMNVSAGYVASSLYTSRLMAAASDKQPKPGRPRKEGRA